MAMGREFSRSPPESGGGDGYIDLLKSFEREEIFEVLSEGFCEHCVVLLETRIQNLVNKRVSMISLSNNRAEESDSVSKRARQQDSTFSMSTSEPIYSERRKGYSSNSSTSSENSKQQAFMHPHTEILLNDGLSGDYSMVDDILLEEQKEQIRLSQVGRKKDFVHVEMLNGKTVNVLRGLELHTRVFSVEEQKNIVECVYNLQSMGQKGQLRERTYSEPRKWMRGKGRITIQFGCCYNYAQDKKGNPPGILRDEQVDPLPPLFKQMIKRMVRWHILPPSCIPNSCIVNIYDEGDCIPPHIDHHDFVRPFCTVSFLTECNILFGSNLKIVGPGEFLGPVSLPLPVGSVLIFNGNGADVAKHCIPAVPAKRISITFRKMDGSKLPFNFSPDPELLGIEPILNTPLDVKSPVQRKEQRKHSAYSSAGRSSFQQNRYQNDKPRMDETETSRIANSKSFIVENVDFPPLGGSNFRNRLRDTRSRSRR